MDGFGGYVNTRMAENVLLDIEVRRKCWEDTVKRAPHYNGKISIHKSDSHKHKSAEKTDNAKCHVTDMDALNLCKQLIAKSRTTLLINHSCYTNKGGGVDTGNNTIEAEICRRSNYRKALKRVENENYPLKPGTLIYTKDVTVFKDADYRTLDETFNLDILSITLPNRPSTIIQDNKELYEMDMHYDVTLKTIQKALHIAYKCNYNVVVFNQLRFSNKHPQDAFLGLIKKCINESGIKYVFIVMSSGDESSPDFEEQRLLWIKYCRNVDNVATQHKNCEEPKRVEIKQHHARRHRDLSKRLGDNYNVEDVNDERNYKSYMDIYKKVESRNDSSEDSEDLDDLDESEETDDSDDSSEASGSVEESEYESD